MTKNIQKSSSLTTVHAETISEPVLNLIEIIRSDINEGKNRAIQALENEKKQMFWTIGKHIKTFLLQDSSRAVYGDTLFKTLSDNIAINLGDLHKSVKFYETYPQIVHAHAQLSWTHIKSLLTIPKNNIRVKYEQKIVKENLSTRDLKLLLKKDNFITKADKIIINTDSESVNIPKLKIKREKPYQYHIKEIDGIKKIDLGFKTYILQRDRAIEPSSVKQYTYKGKVIEIIDGDTLWVDIDLGFDVSVKRKLRLRDIDTPHVDTKDGQDSKSFVVSRLKPCKFVIVKTYWRDKFNRYLADIFYDASTQSLSKVAASGTFLNQELLDESLAVRY
jgi:micrococcal nuclease